IISIPCVLNYNIPIWKRKPFCRKILQNDFCNSDLQELSKLVANFILLFYASFCYNKNEIAASYRLLIAKDGNAFPQTVSSARQLKI
ncbi:MAG: hypothetical protein K2L18_07060, partial [Acetatifactor sp.]|nr:hypothetical protein [Acetatifactor sp.]